MWKIAVLALVCQVVITRAYLTCPDLRIPDLGTSINVLDINSFNDYCMKVIWSNNTYQRQLRRTRPFIFQGNPLDGKVWKEYKLTLIPRDNLFKYIGSRLVEPCENLEKLLEAYFRDIQVEGIPKAWRLFAQTWSKREIAIKFGIDESYVNGNFSYILVKSSLAQSVKEIAEGSRELHLKSRVEESLKDIDNDVVPSIDSFVQKYGTHYVKSLSTGGVLYQVFVYNGQTFQHIESELRDRPKIFVSTDVQELSESQLSYLSPEFATSIGKIISVDGNSEVEVWATEACEQTLNTPYTLLIPDSHSTQLSTLIYNTDSHPRTYSNLYNLHENREVLQQFQSKFKNKALVKLNLSLIAPFIKNDDGRTLLQEKLDGFLGILEDSTRMSLPFITQ